MSETTAGSPSETSPTGGSRREGSEETGQLPPALEGMEVNNHGCQTITGMDRIEMELDDFYFEPTVLVGSPGQTLTVELKNEGSASHTFSLEGQNIDEVLDPGATAEVMVTFPDSGSTVFECRFHAQQGMRGALAVQR